MHITVHMLRAGYELLRTTPPMRGWRLPPGDEVEFQAIPIKAHAADYRFVDGTHVIRLNLRRHANLGSVLRTLAHEMCHMRQQIAAPRDVSHHGKYWKKCARQVCRAHGWDLIF